MMIDEWSSSLNFQEALFIHPEKKKTLLNITCTMKIQKEKERKKVTTKLIDEVDSIQT